WRRRGAHDRSEVSALEEDTMAAKRRGTKNETASRRAPVPADGRGITRAGQQAISIGEIGPVGGGNLVRHPLAAALGGVRDLGGEVGLAATAAVRGSIRAGAEVGGDLGIVTKQAIKGTIQATHEIGGDLGLVARSAARGAVKAADEIGGDVGEGAHPAGGGGGGAGGRGGRAAGGPPRPGPGRAAGRRRGRTTPPR